MPGNEPEDENSGGPPPDPSDRIWVHPTEMTSFVATTRPRASRRGRWVALAAGLTVVAAVAGVVALMTVDDSSAPPRVRSGAIQRIVATLAPSVVAVRTTRGDETGRASGVCVQAGQIVTTAHAVDGADAVAVVTSDGRTLPAAVDASDPVSDLAVLTVDGTSMQPAQLGASAGLQVGQQVVGVAASESARHQWVDVGEIGSFNRAFVWGEGVSVPGLIQTNMTAGGEHSGGALLDTRGEVVGILVVPPDSSTAGLALPIDEARDVTSQLTARGSAEHGWLGVWATDDTDRTGGGARVQGVVPGSPAADAGLVQGDVIVDVGKSGTTTAISSVSQLMSEVGRRKPGEKLNVTLYRDSGKRRVGLELGDQKDASATAGTAPAEPGSAP
jgi:S1-C subfamily serine protease